MPIIGPKLKLGEQWKKNLHSIAQSTVSLTQESQAVSVMSNVYLAKGAATERVAAEGDEQSKMIAVTMNAGESRSCSGAGVTPLTWIDTTGGMLAVCFELRRY